MTGGRIAFPRGGLVEQILTARATREQWAAVRRSGLGGTDVAAIAGVNPWRTPLDVYLDKTGQQATDQRDIPEAAQWGTDLEALIASKWAKTHGRVIRRVGLMRDAAHPHRLASVDRVVLAPASRTATALYEGKTTGLRRETDWTAGIWGDFGRLPAEYLCQVQWYLGITGLDLCHVACLIGGQRLVEVSVPFDPALFDALAADADAFWARHIQACQPPEPTIADLPRLAQLYPRTVDDPVELDDDAYEAVRRYAEAKTRIRHVESEAANHELTIKTALGEHTTGTTDGNTVVTWRPQASRRVDSKALRANEPDIYAKYETTTTVRVLRVPTRNGDQ